MRRHFGRREQEALLQSSHLEHLVARLRDHVQVEFQREGIVRDQLAR